MPGKLISLGKGDQERKIFPVVNLHVFIGSDPYCDLRIKNKGILAQHCLITVQKDKPALIRSLSRASPTLVNGTEIGTKDIELKDHDVITISHRRYKWQYDETTKTPDGNFNLSTKGRKSWPLFKNKLVAVVTPHRRDEGVDWTDPVKDRDLPLKKRRATFGGDKLNTSSKKGKVLGIKAGVKGSKKSSTSKKSSIKNSPSTAKLNLSQAPLSSRKSVKFADTVFHKKLGRRSKSSYGPSTPYRATPGKGKMSLYFTPPTSSGSKKPKKGILKTPGSQSKSQSSSVRELFSSRLSGLGSNTPLGLPGTSQDLDQIVEEESGLRTPPKEMSDQPEIVMRSSKRSSSRSLMSPETTPKSASKSKERKGPNDESLEASERAAKKLKQNPPVAIDKKKMAALLQCHRKSLTPHPAVNGRGRTLVTNSSSKPEVKCTSPSTPISTKKVGRPKKSVPTPYSKVVPKVLRFGSLGNSDGAQQKKKRKPPFQPRSLDRKYPMSKGSVAKMISSPSPPGRKMTRATRAARASREPVHQREVTDVLSALDLSRKWPSQQESSETSCKPTSPIADFTNVSGIKELFSTDRTLDVRQLFLEESSRQSRRSSKSSDSSTNGVEPLSTSSLSQLTASTSRRSLTLKGPRTPLSSPRLLNEVKKSPSKKRSLSISDQSVSTPESQEYQDADESDFSLGSFNSSKYKSRDSSLSLSPASTSQPTLGHSIANKVSRMLLNTNPLSVVKKIRKQRLSLRRMVLSSSTPKALSTSLPLCIEKTPVIIDLTRDSPERSLPLKKRSLKATVTKDIANSVNTSIVIDDDDEPMTVNHSISLSSERDNSSKKVGRPPKKSKTQNDTSSNDSPKGETSNLSDASLRVNIGSIRKNLSDNSLVSLVSPISKLSKSVTVGTKLSPKSVRRSSAPGKIIKRRASRIADPRKTSLLSKSKTSTSPVNRSLILLPNDKLPNNLPSSTPLKVKKSNLSLRGSSKSTRSRSLVHIDLFKLDDKPVTKKSFRSKSAERTLKKSDSALTSSAKTEISSKDIGMLSVHGLNSSNLGSKKATPIKGSGRNKSHISDSKLETSQIKNKSTRSQSTVNVDLFKLDDLSNAPVSRTSRKENTFRSKSAEGKLKNSFEPLVPSPKLGKSKSEKSLLNISKHSVKDRLSRSPVKRVAQENSNLGTTPKQKSTRSSSSVNIDLFKLDDQPRGSVSKSSLTEKSFNGELSEIKLNSPLDFSISIPKLVHSKSGKQLFNISVPSDKDRQSQSPFKSKSSQGKRDRSPDSERLNISVQSRSPVKKLGNVKYISKDSTVVITPIQKSTRSRSSVNIDLFKLDDNPRDSLLNSPLNAQTFRRKSAEFKTESSLVTIFSEKNMSHIANSNEPSSTKNKSNRSRSSDHIDLLKLHDEPVAKVSLNRNSFRSKSAERVSKKATASFQVDTSETNKAKSTRSKSFVNIDLFKLDNKPQASLSESPLKKVAFESKLSDSLLNPMSKKRSMEKSFSVDKSVKRHSRSLSLGASPSNTPVKENERKSLKASKLLNKNYDRPTRSRSSVNIDLFKLDDRASTSPLTTKRKRSLVDVNSPVSKEKPFSPVASTPAISGKKPKKSLNDISPIKNLKTPVKSTRSAFSTDVNLSELNESPSKQNRKSSLTPSLKSLSLSSAKKMSSSSKINTSNTADNNNKQTRTSTINKTNTTSAKQRQFDLLHNIPIINFANDATPICDYQFKGKKVVSPKAKRSLRQKEIDESHRTPEYSTDDKTPLSAFSPKGRRSLSEKQTPVNKFKTSKRSPLNDINQSSFSKNDKKITSTRLEKPDREISSSPAKIDNKKKLNISLSLPRSHNKSNNRSIKDGLTELKQEADSFNGIHKIKQETVKKYDTSNADEELLIGFKSQRVKSPKVVALKIRKLKENKVLSSPIILGSPPSRRTRANKPPNAMNKSSTPARKEKKTKGKEILIKSPKVEISSKKSTRTGKDTINSKNDLKKNKPTVSNEKGMGLNEPKSKKKKSLKIVALKVGSLKENKVLSSSIIKSSPAKGRRTRTNKLSISNVSQKDIFSVQKKKKTKENKSSSESKNKQILLKSHKAEIKGNIRRKNETVKSPDQDTKKSGKGSQSADKKKLGKLLSLNVNEVVKPNSSVKRKTRKAKLDSPVVANIGKRGRDTNSPVAKRGRPAKVKSPVVTGIGKRGRGANSPVKSGKSAKIIVAPVVEQKSPVAKRGRLAKVKSPVVTTIDKRGKGVHSPVKGGKSAKIIGAPVVEQKSPVAKRGRPAKVNSPVATTIGKRGRSANSPVKGGKSAKIAPVMELKSPVAKRGKSAKVNSPVVTSIGKRGRSANSPVKGGKSAKIITTPVVEPKSPVAKRGKSAKVNSPVLTSIGKRGRSANSPVKGGKSAKIITAPVVEQKSPVAKRGRPARNAEPLIISPIVHVQKLKKLKIAPSPRKAEKSKISPLKMSSPAVRRGRPAKSLASVRNIIKTKMNSSPKIKSLNKKEETKLKANLKTVMKATKSKSSTKVKKILKISASSLREITNEESMSQKDDKRGKTTKRTSPLAKHKRGGPGKSTGKQGKPVTPVVQLGRRGRPAKKTSPVKAKSSRKQEKPLTPIAKLGRLGKPTEKGKTTKKTQKK